jgi:hypothetical protein
MSKIIEYKLKIIKGLLVLPLLFFLTNCQESEMKSVNYEFLETLHFQNVNRTEVNSITNEVLKSITGGENIHISTITANQHDQIYLFEWYSGKILKFGVETDLLASAGGRGEGADEFDLENSGVGLIICGHSVIAHDMNRPNVKVYDQNLAFQKKISVTEPIWNISCTDDQNLLVIYVSGHPIDIFNLQGELVTSFVIEDLPTVEYNNLKLTNYAEGRIFTVYAAENLFLIYDLNGTRLREIRFPTIEDDLSKRITARVLKIYTHNNTIHIVAKLNFGLVIHRFTQDGDYINTWVLGNDYINIHQHRDDRMFAIKTGNQQLLNYRLD